MTMNISVRDKCLYYKHDPGFIWPRFYKISYSAGHMT